MLRDGAVRPVTIVIPMRNEAPNVDALVEDLAAQDFTGELEVLVADGGSTDGSGARFREAAQRVGLRASVIENAAKQISAGLNACIERARGDVIVRLDCHTRYPEDYVRRCASSLEETGAWNVGPVVVPHGRTVMERAVACAMESSFGGIHWTRHDRDPEPVDVDTVYLGTFRKDALVAAGGYDESLPNTEDEELNLRLRRAGGRILLDPAIRVRYIPQGSFRGLYRKYYGYGLWKVPLMLKHRHVFSARSVAPLALLGSVSVVAAAAPWVVAARMLLAAEVGVYTLLALAFAAETIHRRGESWRLFPQVAAVFPTFHVAYGVGMLHGWLRTARRLLRR
jgi:succinoglycan biosynthesis protein ExoA